ncbi:MAG: YggS family pyridoxal phosphate-dependent enzyme [Candidatus Omnitrophica bacterium]|nr:YggS family pyridoxal phosphate-dependent enzyme [Candidatus Omnitrophota bacterium]
MIKNNTKKIIACLPENVTLVAATKKRVVQEILEVLEAGVKILGESYVSEAGEKINLIGNKAEWHLIGHLQKNKVKKAVEMFDLIQSLDSLELANVIDAECKKINKVMPALIEINIAKEPQKYGFMPEEVNESVRKIVTLGNIKIMGLMTMGPFRDNPEGLRPYFRQAKDLFDSAKSLHHDNLTWRYLSMGMSDSFKIAIEEGANMVRIGTGLFGPRTDKT